MWNRFVSLIKDLAHGQRSIREYIIIMVAGAIIWLLGTSAGGIVQTEASNYWREVIQPFLHSPIPLWVPCAILPLVLVISFGVGVAASRKYLSVQRPIDTQMTGQENHFDEPFELNKEEAVLGEISDGPVGSATGELLSDRLRVRDGEITSAEFASHVLYRLNQQRIGVKAARRLMSGLGFEIQVLGGGRYTLVEKDPTRRSQ